MRTELAKRIHAYRTGAGMTQAQFGQRCRLNAEDKGMTKHGVSNIEKGAVTHCREETLERLAVGLGSSIEATRLLLPPHKYKTPKTELGSFIQKRRTKLGKTRDEIARAIGKSRHYVSDLELGDITSMNRKIARPLARALKCRPKKLLAFRDNRMKPCLTPIGSSIRERRIHLDLSQATLAKRLDVSPSYISAIERGVPTNNHNLSQLPDEKLQKWADALEMGLAELKTMIPEPMCRVRTGVKISPPKAAGAKAPRPIPEQEKPPQPTSSPGPKTPERVPRKPERKLLSRDLRLSRGTLMDRLVW